MKKTRQHVMMSAALVRRMRSGEAVAILRHCGMPQGTGWDRDRMLFVQELPDGTRDEFALPPPYRIGDPYIVREPVMMHPDHGCNDPFAVRVAMRRGILRMRYASDLTAVEWTERLAHGWSHAMCAPRTTDRFVVRFQTLEVISLLDLTTEQIIQQGFDARHPNVLDAPDREFGIKWQFAQEWNEAPMGKTGKRAKHNPLCWFCTFQWDILRSFDGI